MFSKIGKERVFILISILKCCMSCFKLSSFEKYWFKKKELSGFALQCVVSDSGITECSLCTKIQIAYVFTGAKFEQSAFLPQNGPRDFYKAVINVNNEVRCKQRQCYVYFCK